MKVFNARVGLATNSSSTHSIAFFTEPMRDSDIEAFHYSWDTFTLASTEEKMKYLAVLVAMNTAQALGNKAAAAAVTRELFFPDLPYADLRDGYIDHQSVVALPRSWGGVYDEDDAQLLDEEFIADFKAFLSQPEVVILGGNDNGGTHPSAMYGERKRIPEPEGGGRGTRSLIARKDGGVWVLFNRGSGAKVRFSFNRAAPEYTHASAPELVDFRLTEFCPYNCSYCYMSSTVSGKHADLDKVRHLLYALHGLRVFEIAFGGGEPTMHPNFWEIIETTNRLGMVPNFTTRNTAWLFDPDVRKIFDACRGAAAFSVDKGYGTGPGHLHDIVSRIEKSGLPKGRVVLQYALGTGESDHFLEELFRAAAEAGIPVTLLGFKPQGRGALPQYASTYEERKHKAVMAADKNWLPRMIKLRDDEKVFPRVGIDTMIAKEYAAAIAAKGVPYGLFYTSEGTFSMYIDAVTERVAPSSYAGEASLVSYGSEDGVKAEEIKALFQGFAK